jgi:hypothetical protein
MFFSPIQPPEAKPSVPGFLLTIPLPSSNEAPLLSSRSPREVLITMQETDPENEGGPGTRLEARPDHLTLSLLTGAILGVPVAAYFAAPSLSSMALGALAGMATSGMLYATGVCLVACHQRESDKDFIWLRGDQLVGVKGKIDGLSRSDIRDKIWEKLGLNN